jgi:hypothetical protein
LTELKEDIPLFFIISFLAHLAKGNVSFCHHMASVIRRLLTLPSFSSFGPVVSEENIFKKIGQSETRIACGSHVGFQTSTKNTNLVESHPMNISGKFGSILFSGFREDLNVKS